MPCTPEPNFPRQTIREDPSAPPLQQARKQMCPTDPSNFEKTLSNFEVLPPV
jgi:hypothetical protein